MGCDIHFMIERKNNKDEWVEVKCPFELFVCGEKRGGEWYCGRNYELFGLLAGVRGVTSPLVKRGWDDTISDELKERYEYNNSGYHGYNYIFLYEFLTPRYMKALEEVDAFFIENVINEMKKMHADPSKVRAVFCFDD